MRNRGRSIWYHRAVAAHSGSVNLEVGVAAPVVGAADEPAAMNWHTQKTPMG